MTSSLMQARRHQQLARLAMVLLVSGVTAGASAQSHRDGLIPLFTFHGTVTSSSEAEQAEILLHVLFKTKRRPDGAFMVRTVSYAERSELQGNALRVEQANMRVLVTRQYILHHLELLCGLTMCTV